MTVSPGRPVVGDPQQRGLETVEPPSIASPAIEMRGVSMRYRDRHGQWLPVLDRIDLSVSPGELVAIVGPSGCGKSTLLRLLSGLEEPTSGEVTILTARPAEARRAKAIGLALQDSALLPWRTALENVRLPLEVNLTVGASRDVDRLAAEALARVGLSGFASYYPAQLSGGMRQRVALARTLVFRPSVLLLDEPFAAVDELTRTDLGHELLQLWSESRSTAVLVTHSVPEAVLLADRVVVLSPRPARVLADIHIDLPRPRGRATEVTPRFAERVGAIRSALRTQRRA